MHFNLTIRCPLHICNGPAYAAHVSDMSLLIFKDATRSAADDDDNGDDEGVGDR